LISIGTNGNYKWAREITDTTYLPTSIADIAYDYSGGSNRAVSVMNLGNLFAIHDMTTGNAYMWFRFYTSNSLTGLQLGKALAINGWYIYFAYTAASHHV
jgi:hypothetical protein